MEDVDLHTFFDRHGQAEDMKRILAEFEVNKHNLLFKKGIYVYGNPGTGKTTFVANVLRELNYDMVKYDAGDIRNASVMEDITKHTMSDTNVMSLFRRKAQKIAIVMDEIDGMNNGDKGGINSLIKLIRPKKTKKQKLEEATVNPIICIGNYRVDKKIKELMKVCHVIELKTPTPPQMASLCAVLFPVLEPALQTKVLEFVQGDLRKLKNLLRLFQTHPEKFNEETLDHIFQLKSYNDDTKKITSKLFGRPFSLSEHTQLMNETDRTSVGLLWHENIADVLEKQPKSVSVPFYMEQLDNICFSDFIDRVTFQKQIWQFNEMSSLMKTFKNNKHFHATFPAFQPSEVRFTKVLTKYSTEYNNSLFIQKMCQKLGMDKKDLVGFFFQHKAEHEDGSLYAELERYEINKLDINRMYRYLEKYLQENATGTADKEVDDEGDEEGECCAEA